MGPRARIPWGLLGMLGLLLAVEHLVAARDLDYDTAVIRSWKQSIRAARAIAPQCDVLCLGDSQIKLSIVPQVIESIAGIRSYNLALLGGQVPANYYLLKSALDHGARPRAVIVEFMPTLLDRDRQIVPRLWPELLGLRECFEMACVARDPTFFAGTMLARLLPSLKARYELRPFLLAAVQGKNPSHRRENLYHQRQWRMNRGAQVLPEWPNTQDPKEWYQINFPERWSCDSTNARYLEKLLQLAARHDIEVIWLMPPIHPVAQSQCEAGGDEARFRQFVTTLQSQCPSLTVVDARHSGYDATLFCDSVHLNRRGTYALSTSLGTWLARQRGRSGRSERWANLPTYRARPEALPFEDLDQSRVALETGGDAIRR